jgi:hypothetical protein
MRNAQCRNWNMVKKLKRRKMRKTPCRTRNMARNTEKRVKSEMYTVGRGRWLEN